MGTVIGYKQTSEDRLGDWLTMLETKKSSRIYANPKDETEESVYKYASGVYSRKLAEYAVAPAKAGDHTQGVAA